MNNHKITIQELIQRMHELVGDLQGQPNSPEDASSVLSKFDQYVPLLEEIYNGMQTNTESMPKVSDRLKSAAKLTGEAVGKIMDCTDAISSRLMKIQQEFQRLSSEEPVRELERVLKRLQKRLPADEDIVHANKLFTSTVKGMLDRSRETIQDELAKVQETANQIMMEMQFHDITSQQLGSANYMLLKSYLELRQLLQEKNGRSEDELKLCDDHVNHHAGDCGNTLEQDITDKLIKQFQSGEIEGK